MIPPSFSDLGKGTKDLFSKNFHFGILSVDYLSKSPQGVDLTLKGDNDFKAGKLNGSLEWKYKFENGLQNTVKWDTKNVLSTNCSIENSLAKGSKFSANFDFNPDSGNKSFKFQSSMKREFFNLGLDLAFPNLRPILTPFLVLGCTESKSYLAGAQITYDTNKMALTRHTVAIGYHKNDLSLIGTIANRTDIEALVFQKINPQVDLGVQIKWNWNSRVTEFGIAAKYDFSNESFVKGKINNKSLLGLAYCFKARDNVKITLNAEIDGRDLENGSHKFGMGLSYEP